MATMKPHELNAAARRAAFIAQRTKMPSMEEAAPDVIQAFAGDPFPSASTVGMYAGMFGGALNLAALGNDIVLPALVNGMAGTANLAGKGAKKVGAAGAASKLTAAGDFVSGQYDKHFASKAIASVRGGESFADLVHQLVDPFYKAGSFINNKTGWFSKFANRASIKSEQFANKAASMAANVTNVPAEVTGAIQHLLTVPFGDHHALGDVTRGIDDLLEKAGPKVSRATRSQIKKTVSLTENAHLFANKSSGWTEWATGQHLTRANVKNAPLQRGVGGTLFSVASVASVVGTTAETISDVSVFRQMVADITGKDVKDVNVGDALFSELPHAGIVARRALLSSAAPRAVLEAINTVFNIKMIKGSHMGLLTLMVPLGLSQAIGIFSSGNVLDVYKEMKANEQKGIENMPDQYAALIGTTHKALYQRGGRDSNFAQELGRIYAERHASVHDVLQAVQNGQIDKEIEKIIAHNTKEAKQENVPVTELNAVNAVAPNALARMHSVDHAHDIAKGSFAERVSNQSHEPVVRQ